MELSLANKTAVITGASRGIGLAIASRMAESGANVMLSSRREDNLLEAAATLVTHGPRVAHCVAHVGRSEDADRVIAATRDRFGAVDILVNNAATNPYFGPLVEIDDARMHKTYEVNQASVVTHTRAAWHAWMKEHGGVVINISSVGGLGPEPGLGWYNVTKAAVIHLTKQLSYELSPTVRVNAIAPGLVKTDMARALWEPHEEAMARRIPLQRLGEVDDIATAALFLASDAASWITGQTLVVDGGSTTQPSGAVG